jgi:trans-aconitate 2-methyltransferase
MSSPADRPSGAVDFSGRYGTLDGVADKVSRAVLDCISEVPEPLIVEIGCGTGETALAIAAARRDARVVGLDISPANIAAAGTLKAANAAGDRVEFVAADFMTWPCPHADLLFCQSVLHLIEADTFQLVQRLAWAIKAGGVLAFTMPRACARNHALFLARRGWSLVPRALADRAALAVARRLYPKLSADMIIDRLSYMRLIPSRLDDLGFRELLQRQGFVSVRRDIWPVTAVVQPSHTFSVWRKVGHCVLPVDV